MRRWLRIAHRGASGRAPENTVAAFRKAVETGVDGVEMDIRLSADNEVVVLHDEELDRTTDRTGAVAALTLAEIKEADAGDGERVPTLREALQAIPGDVLAFVEIKSVEATEPFARIAQEMDRLDQIVAISFQAEALRRLRAFDHRIPAGFLIGKRLAEDDAQNGLEMLRAAQAAGTSTVSCNWRIASAAAFREIRRRGGTVWTWTVNDPRDIREMLEIGADAVTSDYPERLNEVHELDT